MNIPKKNTLWIRILHGVAILLATVSLTLSVVGVYVDRQFLNTNRFVNRTIKVVHKPEVELEIASQLVNQLVKVGGPTVAAFRPLVEFAVQKSLDSGAFDPVLRLAVGKLHKLLVDGKAETLVLNLSDSLKKVIATIAIVAPGVAKQISDATQAGIVKITPPQWAITSVRNVKKWHVFYEWLLFLTAAFIGLVLITGSKIKYSLRHLALICLCVGTGVAVAVSAGRVLLRSAIENETTKKAAIAAFNAYIGDLARNGIVLAGLGIITVSVLLALSGDWSFATAGHRIRGIITLHPENGWAKILRAGILLLIGVVVLVNPVIAEHVVVAVLGVGALVLGLCELLRAVFQKAKPLSTS